MAPISTITAITITRFHLTCSVTYRGKALQHLWLQRSTVPRRGLHIIQETVLSRGEEDVPALMEHSPWLLPQNLQLQAQQPCLVAFL